MKGQTEASGIEFGTATLGASGMGRGLFQTPKRFGAAADDSERLAAAELTAGRQVFSRRVGFQYSLQVFLNSLPLLMTDIVALAVTIIVVRLVSKFPQLTMPVGIDVSACLPFVVAGFVTLNFQLSLYPGVRLSPVEELRRLSASITGIFVAWAVGVWAIVGTLADYRWLLLSALYVSCLLVLPIARGWTRHLLGNFTNWGIPTLVFGDDAAAVRLHQWLADNHHLGLRPMGVIGDRQSLDAGPDDDWYAGGWNDTQRVAEERGVFWAVVVPPEDRSAAISSLIADYLFTIPQVHVLSELTGLPDHWNPQRLDGLTGIQLQQNLMLPFPRLIKRCMDIVAAILGGICLLPILLPIAVIVKMSSRGPVLYGHERIGRYGRRFKAWKFRTMFQNSNQVLDQYLEDNPELLDEWNRDHKLKCDPRVTRIGRFMRKTSIDELPQLWNVIWGDMSLVGPRPIVTGEIAKYGHYFSLYTMVKPGITGLWQVSGRNNTTYDERVQLDAYYVRNWTPWLDVFLLLRTIRIVLFARGAY